MYEYAFCLYNVFKIIFSGLPKDNCKIFWNFFGIKKNPEIIICGMIQMKTIENQITTSKAWLRDFYYCYIYRPKKLDMEHSV